MSDWADEEYCYVTTTGRRTGRPHRIEIWFAVDEATLYLLSGGGDRADWVRNIRADGRVILRVGDREGPATARVVEDAAEAALARRIVPAKYARREDGLDAWAVSALPVAIRFDDVR